jgi:aminopeptidase N
MIQSHIMRPHGTSALLATTVTLFLGTCLTVCAQQAPNPFAPPAARLQVAPVSGYDLQNLTLDLSVDYPKRVLTGIATNTIRTTKPGLSKLRFHAGASTKVDAVSIDRKPAPFTRDEEGILVDCKPAKLGQRLTVIVRYHLDKRDTPRGEGVTGWHWNEPQKNDPSRLGFWTKGEPEHNRDWAVTWDYPNDFTSTETRTTVPAGWDVIGNGLLVSDQRSADGKSHTVVWRMKQPHATYLISLVAGPMDIQRDQWRGIPLIYAAPKGPKPGSAHPDDVGFDHFRLRRNDGGKSLAYTTANTKAMLEFFTRTFGVDYPWPKYAQTFTYDHNGGMENVSATTLGNFLTSPRQSHYGSDSVLAHELAHQWFGDLVTCNDWGQLWLNEGITVFAEMLWIRENRGLNALQRSLGFRSLGLFGESQSYKRPLATNFYENPEAMFDSHSYEKGGLVMHSLRMSLGDKAFFSGITRYLKQNRHRPVDTDAFRKAMSEAAGKDLRPWFDMWVLKPGHPVIEWSWSWDEAKREVVVNVMQTQDTASGTPIYEMATEVALLIETVPTHVERRPIHVRLAEQEFRIPYGVKPDAVVFDPDHDYLRQIRRNPWTESELQTVARYAPDCFDRQSALNRMLTGTPSAEVVEAATSVLQPDRGVEPAFIDTSRLLSLKRSDLRGFWEDELGHEHFGRRSQAVAALGLLPPDAGTNSKLRSMVNDREPYDVVTAVIRTLGKLDFTGNRDLIEGQARTSLERDSRAAALALLIENKAEGAADLVFQAAEETQPIVVQSAAFDVLQRSTFDDPRLLPLLRANIASDDYQGLVFEAVSVARNRKMKELLPELRELAKRTPFAIDFLQTAIKAIESAPPPGS